MTAALYVIVEGRRTEPILYRAWLPLLLPGYSRVQRIEDAGPGTFFIIAGNGYPSYLQRIKAAIEDLGRPESAFTHLMICVDSEDVHVADREAELQAVVDAHRCPVPCALVVANCCIETWLLGHRTVVCRTPQSPILAEMLRYYNVIESDPEGMSAPQVTMTRAQYHLRYLREVFSERSLTYSKVKPGTATEPHYFEQLRRRAACDTDGVPHLRSFGRLLAIPEWLGETTATPQTS